MKKCFGSFYKNFLIVNLSVMLSIGSITGCSIGNGKVTENLKLERIVKHPMNTSVMNSSKWFFFHKDRLYTYDDSDNGEASMVSYDMHGKDKRVVAKDKRLVYPTIMLVYKDKMFYKTSYETGIMTLDLNTGDVKNFVKDHYYHILPDTLDGNEVVVEYDNNYVDKAKTVIATLNLDTGEVKDEKEMNFTADVKYLDTESMQAYYVTHSKDKSDLYVDNEIKNTLDDDDSYVEHQNNITYQDNVMFVQDGYLFMLFYDRVFKIDRDTFEVIAVNDLDNHYRPILSTHFSSAVTLGTEENDSVLATHPYFDVIPERNNLDGETSGDNKKDNAIYKFNSESMKFEKIVDKQYGTDYVEKHGDYCIFQDSFNTVIYNESTGTYATLNATDFSVEDGYIYMIEYNGDLYHQKSNKVRYSLKKEKLDEICK